VSAAAAAPHLVAAGVKRAFILSQSLRSNSKWNCMLTCFDGHHLKKKKKRFSTGN
jgi:hypothetical protein